MCRRLLILTFTLGCLLAARWPVPVPGAAAGERVGPPGPTVAHIAAIKCLDPDTGRPFAPLGVAFDLGGGLCIVDSDNSRLLTVPDSLSGPVFFADCPASSGWCQLVDVAADAGLYYVSDRSGGRIAVLDSDGRMVSEVKVGQDVGGLCLGRAGQVYAAMTVSGAVVAADVFGEKSLVTCPVSDGGGSSYPLDCLVLGSGRVLVTDALSAEVLVLSSLGKRLGLLEGFDFKSPFGLSRCSGGMVLVSDSDLGVVAVFDSSGKFLGDFGKGQLKTPTFLDTTDDGKVCVSDVGRMTVEVFRINAPAEN